ncbi:unnamed protein product [Boreogadus saida]
MPWPPTSSQISTPQGSNWDKPPECRDPGLPADLASRSPGSPVQGEALHLGGEPPPLRARDIPPRRVANDPANGFNEGVL